MAIQQPLGADSVDKHQLRARLRWVRDEVAEIRASLAPDEREAGNMLQNVQTIVDELESDLNDGRWPKRDGELRRLATGRRAGRDTL